MPKLTMQLILRLAPLDEASNYIDRSMPVKITYQHHIDTESYVNNRLCYKILKLIAYFPCCKLATLTPGEQIVYLSVHLAFRVVTIASATQRCDVAL